jgi:hypothetical protein
MMSKYGVGYNTLTQEELNEMFSRMCFYEDFNEVKYILTSPDIKLRPNLNFKLDEPFAFLLEDKNLEILQYLIIEHNMEKTKNIVEIMQKNESEFIQQVEELFNIRDLKCSLDNELVKNDGNVRKAKI